MVKEKLTRENLGEVQKGRENVEKVLTVIEDNKLDAQIWSHPKIHVTSLQSHLELYGGTANEVLKCLCFVSKGRPLVVMASGEVKIDMNKLSKVSHMKDARMARLDELERDFSKGPGEVDPLTISKKIPVFADKKLFEKEKVVGSAGCPFAGLEIKPQEILKVQNPIIEDLAV